MTAGGGVVVIGIGNVYRRDDGVGPAVAAALADRCLPGVKVLSCAAEPTAILEAWTGSRLAILVDAAMGGLPGETRVRPLDELTEPVPVSSHDLSLRKTYELGRALGRAPASVVVLTVAAADTGHGAGLSPAVAAALPEAVRAVELLVGEKCQEAAHQEP